jgi:hypothetical protein
MFSSQTKSQTDSEYHDNTCVGCFSPRKFQQSRRNTAYGIPVLDDDSRKWPAFPIFEHNDTEIMRIFNEEVNIIRISLLVFFLLGLLDA